MGFAGEILRKAQVSNTLFLQLFFEFFDNYSVFSYANVKVLTTEIHPWPTCYRDNLSLII